MSLLDGKFEISVTAASGIEAVAKREIAALGYLPSSALYGRIRFEGDLAAAARANMFLRTANHVYIDLTEFNCLSFDDLFEGIYSFPWEQLLPQNARVTVDAKSVKSQIFALSAIQRVAKKAIVERLCGKYNLNALSESGELYPIEVSLSENRALIALDTSGTGLHKRGYRILVGQAPLSETLAAALLLLSGWRGDRPFCDIFCGSGTIPIEAALIATDTAPSINRDFAFTHFNCSTAQKAFKNAKEEAFGRIKSSPDAKIAGYDINPDAIKMAAKHAQNANVGGMIHFQVRDMRDFSTQSARGTMICNLPYGERLCTERELRELYHDFGTVYRKLNGWDLCALTAYPNFEKLFGRTAQKRRKLFNSQLECTLYQYYSPRT